MEGEEGSWSNAYMTFVMWLMPCMSFNMQVTLLHRRPPFNTSQGEEKKDDTRKKDEPARNKKTKVNKGGETNGLMVLCFICPGA